MEKMPQIVSESEEETIDNIEMNIEETEQEPDPEPEPEPLPEKVKVQVDDVFKKAEILETAPVIKKPKRTRKMSPEALEKLAIARQKGLETRRRNKELRAKGEMPTPSEKKDKEKKEEIERKRPVVNNVVHETKNITNNITHEDIMKISKQATEEALSQYEDKRKQRKAEKKKKYEEKNQQAIVQNKINKALGHKYGSDNFFDACF